MEIVQRRRKIDKEKDNTIAAAAEVVDSNPTARCPTFISQNNYYGIELSFVLILSDTTGLQSSSQKLGSTHVVRLE